MLEASGASRHHSDSAPAEKQGVTAALLSPLTAKAGAEGLMTLGPYDASLSPFVAPRNLETCPR